MAIHELKTWSDAFEPTRAGYKTAEIRLDDRNFQVGDELILREYCPKTKTYSGRSITVLVRHRMEGRKFGLSENYVLMSIVLLNKVKFGRRR